MIEMVLSALLPSPLSLLLASGITPEEAKKIFESRRKQFMQDDLEWLLKDGTPAKKIDEIMIAKYGADWTGQFAVQEPKR